MESYISGLKSFGGLGLFYWEPEVYSPFQQLWHGAWDPTTRARRRFCRDSERLVVLKPSVLPARFVKTTSMHRACYPRRCRGKAWLGSGGFYYNNSSRVLRASFTNGLAE